MTSIRYEAFERTIAGNDEQIAIELGNAVGSREEEDTTDLGWVSFEEICNGEWSIGAGRKH